MSSIAYEADWKKRLRKKIYNQFRGKPNILLWVDMVARQFQDLEDAAQTLITMPSIEDSIGVQLQVLGRIIGQVYAGEDDATFRLYLRARSLANKSRGTVEDIFKVMRALFGLSAGLTYFPGFVKQFALRIATPLTPLQASVALEFLGDSKEAGARGVLEWIESPLVEVFQFDSGPGFDVGKFAGADEA